MMSSPSATARWLLLRPIGWLALLLGLAGLLPAGAQQPGEDMEALMRQFQSRWMAIHHSPYPWPAKPDGTPAPAFPDGFYGETMMELRPEIYSWGSPFGNALNGLFYELFQAQQNDIPRTLSLNFITTDQIDGLTPAQVAAMVVHYAKVPKLSEISPFDKAKQLELVKQRLAEMQFLIVNARNYKRTTTRLWNRSVAKTGTPELADAATVYQDQFAAVGEVISGGALSDNLITGVALSFENVYDQGNHYLFFGSQTRHDYTPELLLPVATGAAKFFSCVRIDSNGIPPEGIESLAARCNAPADNRYHLTDGDHLMVSPPPFEGRTTVGEAAAYPSRTNNMIHPSGLFNHPPSHFANANGGQIYIIPMSAISPEEGSADSLACSDCDSAQPNGSAANCSARYSISLGRDRVVGLPGSLLFHIDQPSPEALTPDVLTLGGDRDSETVHDSTGTLRQFVAGNSLAVVSRIDPALPGKGYLIDVYHRDRSATKDAAGLYPTTGPKTASFSFANDDPSAARFDRFTITEMIGGHTEVTRFSYLESDNSWTMNHTDGRRNEHLTKTTDPEDPALRTEIRTVEDAGGGVISRTLTIYRRFDFGEEMVSRTVDPTLRDTDGNIIGQGRDLTTTWDYYSLAESSYKAGLLKLVVSPTGSWSRYEYSDARDLTKAVYSYLDSPLDAPDDQCRVIRQSRSQGAGGTTTTSTESLLGSEISKTFRLVNEFGEWQQQRGTAPGASWGDPSNLVSSYSLHRSGPLAARPGKFTRADGTATIYDYAIDGADFDNSDTLTTTVSTGQPAPDGLSIVDGTRTITRTNRQGSVVSTVATDIASGLQLSSSRAATLDEFGRPTTIETLNAGGEVVASATSNYDCCGLANSTDRTGIYTEFKNDDELISSQTSLGVRLTNAVSDAARPAGGMVETTTRTAVDPTGEAIASTSTLLSRRDYDTSGRLIAEFSPPANVVADPPADELGVRRATTFDESVDPTSGHRTRTVTRPDSSTIITESAADGRTVLITGTGTHHSRFDYGIDTPPVGGYPMRFTRTVRLNADGSDSGEWIKEYTDFAGRQALALSSSGATSRWRYNSRGQLADQSDPDGVTVLFEYDSRGRLETTAIDLDRNGVIDYGGSDRISRTTTIPIERDSRIVLRTTTVAWTTDGDPHTTAELSRFESSTDGLHTWSITDGLETHTEMTYAGGGNYSSTTTYPDATSSESLVLGGRLGSVTNFDSTGSQITSTTYGYDPLGRTSSASDARNGTTTFRYYADDRLHSTTTPDPDGTGPQLPRRTSLSYDAAGRRETVTLPDGATVHYQYHPTGELRTQSGARSYSRSYTYDYAGRLKSLTAGTGTTNWNYFPDSGLLESKRYADNQGPSFTHTLAGRPLTRTLARGLHRRTSYGDGGQARAVDYFSDDSESIPDPLTPAFSTTYDRLGNPETLSDAAGLHRFATTPTGRFESETISGGLLDGATIDPGYDALLRRHELRFSALGAPDLIHSYRYNSSGRTSAIAAGSDPTNSPRADYSYHPNSNLLESTTSVTPTGTARHTSTRNYDALGRLTDLHNSSAGGDSPLESHHHFDHNAAGQRERITLADGGYWEYRYDQFGQLESANKYLADGSPIASQTHSFTHDSIGNRTSSSQGTLGASPAKTGYTPNSLNQYTTTSDSGHTWITGAADPAAIIHVNGATATRPGASRPFEFLATSDNSAGATLAKFKIEASLDDAQERGTRFARVPAASSAPAYDTDGNLVSDSFYSYRWDGEDRLIAVETRTGALPTSFPHHRLEFRYDSSGRRIEKKVFGLVDGSWQLARHKRFLYDGWNLLAEYEPDSNDTWQASASYLWGNDLSGTLQGAGGTGGLLHLRDHAEGNAYFVAYDGRGNVSALINETTGETAAEYEYSPFGKLTTATGPAAHLNPFRFSTRYQDTETGLYYYGYRYYDPTTGRWMSRDPLGEDGGLNLYGFVGNDPADRFDILGLLPNEHALPEVRPAQLNFAPSLPSRAPPKVSYPAFPPPSVIDAIHTLPNKTGMLSGDSIDAYWVQDGRVVAQYLKFDGHSLVWNYETNKGRKIFGSRRLKLPETNRSDGMACDNRKLTDPIVAAALDAGDRQRLVQENLDETLQEGVAEAKTQVILAVVGHVVKLPRTAPRRGAFRLAKHGDMPSPRPGQQSHHGAMSAWMKKHFDGYNPNKAPAILMPEANHRATFGVYNTWRAQMRKNMGGTFDWKAVSETDMRVLSEKMFNAADVPGAMRQDYWSWFDRMKGALSN